MIGGEFVECVQIVIGSRIGASRTNLDGSGAVRDRSTEVCVWNCDMLDGSLNVFQDIDDYLTVRMIMECGTDRFFLAGNPHGKTFDRFFKIQYLSRSSFTRIVEEVSETVGVQGYGFADGMTARGLRGTVMYLLFESGCGDSTVVLRTSHRDLRSLESYHNLRGALGRDQQDTFFGGKSKKAKLEIGHTYNKENTGSNVVNGLHERDKAVAAADRKPENNAASAAHHNDRAEALLARIQAIFRGSFTFNVHNRNHYR